MAGYRYESAVPDASDNSWRNEPELRIDGLGPGWERTENALAAIQADLSRTVADAPHLILLWHETEDGQRNAYLGKGRDWYYTGDGVIELSRDYVDTVVALAWHLRGAINDSLLGALTDWPICPRDGWTPTVTVEGGQECVWSCEPGGHTLSEVGRLGG